MRITPAQNSQWLYTAILIICLSMAADARADIMDWLPFGKHGMAYTIRITGVDKDTLDWFKSLKLTEKTSNQPPDTNAELDQEGISLENRLRRALAAKGYYDALVSYRMDTGSQPPVLLYQITPGERYRIANVRLDWQGSEIKHVDTAQFPVKVHDFVDAAAITAHAAKMLVEIGKDACLLSLDIIPLLELDHQNHQAVLVYQIKHGDKAKFGAVNISGNSKVDEKVIRRAVTWKQGKCFNEADINKTRSTLIGNQLFSTVTITPASHANAAGDADVAIVVKERVERTVTLGGTYATDQGYGVKAGWEHRNLFGDGEKFNADLTLAEQQQTIALTNRIPAFMRDDQILVLTGSIDHQDTDAYSSRAVNAGAAVERKLAPSLNSGLGVAYLLTRTDDTVSGLQNYGLVSLPGFLEYDTRDNAQDAHKGIYARAALTPYADTFDFNTDFLKALLTAQTYLTDDKLTGKPTLALRGSFGTIAGAPSASLPSDLRFYAGGGGSVRGYAYQSISPYFNGSPIGGGSMVNFSGELRVHVTETIGAVVFLDGGNAYASGTPDFGSGMYFGAGAGIRYYSPLGPLRLDVGIPLNGHNIDNSGVNQTGYALYVSIGQDF